MKYSVIYTSQTGNTQKLAMEIFAAIPDSSKDCCRTGEFTPEKDAGVYFVGFWTDRGTCSMEVIDFLGGLHGKKIALFGTCGMGANQEYYHKIEEQVKVFIPEDNEYLGAFLCQGKMPIQVRNKYKAMENESNAAQMEMMLQNFDEALLHPDQADFDRARAFVRSVLDM